MTYSREKGIQIFEEIYGAEASQGLQGYMASGAFGSEYAQWSTDLAFGTVWASEGLERKLRSCAVIGMLIGMRSSEELYYHAKMGTANGLSRKELEEIVNTAVPYCGLPAANVAKAAFLRAFKEMDDDAVK
jgi:alkylhydroperoxidase/carboxymuconolactone decarboxylase family protein YurZ